MSSGDDLTGLSKPFGAPDASSRGVATVPPPASLLESMQKQVLDAVKTLPDGARGALVGVGTTAGINLAVVSKVGTHVEVTAWVGKSWGEPVSGGTAVRVSW